jgi:glycosyltransferase involved in cell wall biosynthesis
MIAVLLTVLVWSTLCVTAMVSTMFLWNLTFFRRAPDVGVRDLRASDKDLQVSVLIPARNEALRIGQLLDSVLRNEGINCEVCVLDDESDDGTDEVVGEYSQQHKNVRLIPGISVPPGWSGKQFACWQLAEQARYSELVFLDADVTLSADGLRRALLHRRSTKSDLLSGFPQQRVVTLGEQLLIPLIHLILLCFLPFRLMRMTGRVEAAAGCGQFFLTTKEAYGKSGGHSSIKQSLHDGIMLPRSYRIAGLKTDLFDASDIATCRMYASFAETWSGLLKNATEGFAKMPLLPVMTLLMLLAFVSPWIMGFTYLMGGVSGSLVWPIVASCALCSLPRFICCWKYDRAWLACLLNPISIMLFLIIQWTALLRKYRRRGVQWRQRSYEVINP